LLKFGLGINFHVINFITIGLVFDKQLITFKMLSLEQRIYLIQCWTGFCHIITKFNEKFPNSYVSGMGVQKLKLRHRVELCTGNGA
jgi:hypothetical protein